ncbi:signal peptidase I [Bacillus sp. FJAT-49711]|uniref:signal peptidase I n=1 Tax=Bacillus sp. FJAT-49711 TaxID=2833585 RepID=UPI001BC91D7A|nr:signal peptidase I [Bacillus sp. FJAT-49711]MBS4217593.1 signal peptidase I [Bacillus sp. FJAT-49711]
MKKSTKKEIYSWMKSIALAFIIAFICRQFLFTPTTVFGESMSPTFHEHDRIVVSKTTKIERFDVIVFNAPDANKHYIKRVIGLPGDRIKVQDDILYVNGKEIKEPYLIENKKGSPLNKITWDFTLKEITGKSNVPKGVYFVMGDNRLYSKDSRSFGFVSAESVIGEVKFRFYPLEKIGNPK